MRLSLSVLFVVIFLSSGIRGEGGELRDFTDDQGRVIKAEIVLVKNGKVHLKRSDKTFQFPFAKLSKDDQDFVRQWAKDNVQYWFSFNAKVASDPSKRTSDGSGKKKTVRSERYYEVEVSNRSGVAVKAVRVEYRMAVRRDWKRKSSSSSRQQMVYMLAGSESIASLENTKRVKLRLRSVKLIDAKWQKEERYIVNYSDGRSETKMRTKDYSMAFILDGLWIKLFLGDRMIGEYKSGEKTMKNVAWEKVDAFDAEGSLQRIASGS